MIQKRVAKVLLHQLSNFKIITIQFTATNLLLTTDRGKISMFVSANRTRCLHIVRALRDMYTFDYCFGIIWQSTYCHIPRREKILKPHISRYFLRSKNYECISPSLHYQKWDYHSASKRMARRRMTDGITSRRPVEI